MNLEFIAIVLLITSQKKLKEINDQRSIHGFDSFKGLSENWTGHRIRKYGGLKGARFDINNMPEVENNVHLHCGLIDETLPPFLDKHEEEISFIHIDTDTYSPAKIALELCKDHLCKNALILFDELIGYPNW